MPRLFSCFRMSEDHGRAIHFSFVRNLESLSVRSAGKKVTRMAVGAVGTIIWCFRMSEEAILTVRIERSVERDAERGLMGV